MTALAHFMGLACIFKRHRCGNGRAELAGFNQGRYLDKLIGVRLNCYHRTPNAVALAGIFRRLTDGRNNAGKISPLTAAEAAEVLNIKIYTIGAGTKGLAPYPAEDFFGNRVYRQVKIEIDEKSLQKIARKTGARYFRATDTDSLRKIYEEIDELEKTPIEEKGYTEYRELFHLFLIPGLLLLIIEIILRNTLLRRIP